MTADSRPESSTIISDGQNSEASQPNQAADTGRRSSFLQRIKARFTRQQPRQPEVVFPPADQKQVIEAIPDKSTVDTQTVLTSLGQSSLKPAQVMEQKTGIMVKKPEEKIKTEKDFKGEIIKMEKPDLEDYIKTKLKELENTFQGSKDQMLAKELSDIIGFFDTEQAVEQLQETLEFVKAALVTMDPNDQNIRLIRFAVNELGKKLKNGQDATQTPETELEENVLNFGERQTSETDKSVDVRGLPWAKTKDEGSTIIPLQSVRFAGTDIEFFLGDAIKINKELVDAYEKLPQGMEGSVDKIFFASIQPYLRNEQTPRINLMINGLVKKLYEISAPSGLRIHFIELDPVDGKPVIMRIAVYDKPRQAQVFGQITSESRAQTKKRSGV